MKLFGWICILINLLWGLFMIWVGFSHGNALNIMLGVVNLTCAFWILPSVLKS